MNTNKNSQLDHFNNNKRVIRRKRSYFWNLKTPCETIDSENLSEIGTDKQTVNTNDESISSKPRKKNIFSKIYKKVNDILIKSSNTSQNLTGYENKTNNNTSTKHSEPMMKKQLLNEETSNRIPLSTANDYKNTVLSPSLLQPQLKGDKNELNEWKNTLLNELDATQNGIKNDRLTLFDLRTNDNTDCNDLVINTLQPSGMENNRNTNQCLTTTLDAKLGIIPRKTMIDDWLHYNSSIPESATSEMPVSSYLQHYHIGGVNADKIIVPEEKIKPLQDKTSLLSEQFKREGKEKYDHVKERLEIAAARRNAIKTNRLKEQMDTALFETIHMLRESHDIYNQQTFMQQQNVEDWLFSIDRKSDRRTYLSSASEATMSTSPSNDYRLTSQGNKHHHLPEEDTLIW